MFPARRYPWPKNEPLGVEALEALLRDEGLRPSHWSNGPGDRYGVHSHAYHKVLYCVQGGIRFDLPDSGESFGLRAGDRLEIPPGTRRWSVRWT